jgi:hypothetical protein
MEKVVGNFKDLSVVDIQTYMFPPSLLLQHTLQSSHFKIKPYKLIV